MHGEREYARPESLADAVELLRDGLWRPVAGATDLYPAMVTRQDPGPWLDLGGLRELRGIDLVDGVWRIGALVCWRELAEADLPEWFHALRQAAVRVGGRQIQNVATICGNIVNASPAADGAPPLLALDASVELCSVDGRRQLPLHEFLLGNRKTARRNDELVTALLVPDRAATDRSVFLKLGARSHLVISISMVAVRVERDLVDGRVGECAVAVGACAPTARRLPRLERRLRTMDRAAACTVSVEPDDLAPLAPIDDVRASAAYRLEATATLIRRAMAEVLPEECA